MKYIYKATGEKAFEVFLKTSGKKIKDLYHIYFKTVNLNTVSDIMAGRVFPADKSLVVAFSLASEGYVKQESWLNEAEYETDFFGIIAYLRFFMTYKEIGDAINYSFLESRICVARKNKSDLGKLENNLFRSGLLAKYNIQIEEGTNV